ncbi:MAG TPA: O-antigen ligase family protein [Chloroflexota bacterium]|nr:O-antigen ligase family protein [Chloroflexota bacterium]
MIDALLPSRLSVDWHVTSQRRRLTLLAAGALVASIFYAWLVILSPIASPLTLFTWLGVATIAWRPRVGLYFAFVMVLLFEAGNADQMMAPGAYFMGGLSSMVGLPGVIASPLELLLLLTFGFWLAKGVARRKLDFRGGRLQWPMIVFLVFLVAGLLRGVLSGGDLNIALWESRFLFYIVICYFLATNTIREPQHVRQLLALSLVAMGLWAIEGAYRRIALIDTGLLGVVPEFAYAHETVVFLGVLILLIVAQQVFGASLWLRLCGLALLPVAIYTLLATERRAGYIAVMIAFLALSVVFLFAKRKAFFLITVPVLIVVAIYLPHFWNDTSMLGQPARAVRSLREPDPRDAASNMYRELEKINVRYTIQANPVLGVGFGRQFLFVVGLPDLSWWAFWHYEPHHNILWIWLKIGAGGFIAFFTLMGAALARAGHLARHLHAPEGRVAAVLALTSITASLVFSYVDLGLTAARIPVLLGTTIGALAVLDHLPWPARAARPSSPAGGAGLRPGTAPAPRRTYFPPPLGEGVRG